MRKPLRSHCSALAWFCALLVLGSALPAFAASDRCPSVNAIGNFLQSSTVETGFSVDPSTGTVTYTFASTSNFNPLNGVPGLITYCVYPQGSNNPDGGLQALVSGANGAAWQAFLSAKGSFSFTRPDGDPSNVPFDGVERTIGTATWSSSCVTDPDTLVTVCTVPGDFTILLHINDPAECQNLYGGTTSTCWVYPGGGPPKPPCDGEPACKSAEITEATGAFTTCIVNGVNYGSCPIVPLNTLLHIHYSYMIVNQATNSFNMIFKPPTPKTKDINSGGGKDYFGCEQIPDPNGQPGSFGVFNPFENTGMKLNFTQGSGTCNQSRFTLTASGYPVVLQPGQSITFGIDMITRSNKGGKQEYTSCGPHLLNSGFTVKWIESDDGMLHSFTTGITPIYVFAGDPASCQ